MMTVVGNVSSRSWILLVSFTCYFALFLVPKALPAVGTRMVSLILLLSIVVVLPTLVGLAIWGAIGRFLSRRQKRPVSGGSRWAGQIAIAGFGAFVLFLLLANILPSALPTGSYANEFDQSTWLHLKSADYVHNDITPRQKMLAAVVAKLPGSTRAQLEQSLGPSLETGYFMSTGRDLIYVLGPERDTLFGIDSEWLLIWLDENGVFARYEIARD
jgi:hypothetical protein